ncbi:MAG: hypothetical protein IJW92_05905 [Clostridia bacterium]|nr:hypothetical protein [Clostridia bacterium]
MIERIILKAKTIQLNKYIFLIAIPSYSNNLITLPDITTTSPIIIVVVKIERITSAPSAILLYHTGKMVSICKTQQNQRTVFVQNRKPANCESGWRGGYFGFC